MPVTANSVISVSDYTAIRNVILAIMGTGSSTRGYGQVLFSESKTVNDLVDQTDWDNLRYDIVNARIHQTGSAFSAVSNASNNLDRTKIQFATSSVPFLVLGMTVFTVTLPITTVKYITDIQVSGSNTIITLNSITEGVVSSGTTIFFGPGSVSDFNEGNLVSASLINAYESLGLLADSDPARFAVAAGQFLTIGANSDGSALVVSRTWSSTTAPQFWKDEINCTLTISFGSSNQARWFFNSGGELRVQSTRTGGRSDAQNNSWSALLSSAGIRAIGVQTPTSGFSPMNGQNFYRLTNTFQSFYTLTDSSPYTLNRYVLEARSNVVDNSSGTATSVEIRIRFIAGYADPGDGPLDFPRTNDEIDGTFSVTVTEKRASGTLVPTGNFVITRPTYSITSIAGT
jgi:hypothetical protein